MTTTLTTTTPSAAPVEAWKPKKLSELGFVGRGRSRHRPRDDESLYGGPYPFIQTSDIKAADLYVIGYTQTYNEKGLAQSKLWQPGTLCITIAANIAETAVLKIPACFPDSVVGFIADPAKADVRFVKYYIDTIKLRMQNVSRGTTQDNLSLEKLLTFDILTPPLPTQRKLAAILSAYDDLIENNTRRIANLEAMARVLYTEWFVRFRFPGHESCRLVDSPLGPIPGGWQVVKLGEIAQEARRGVDPTAIEPDTPYIGLEHMPRRSIALSVWGAARDVQSTKLAFKKGEILFGKIRPYFHKVGIAPLDGVCSTDAIVIRPCSDEYLSLVLCIVSSDEFVRRATQTSQGTKMPRANWDILTSYPVALPPQSVNFRFDELVRDVITQIGNLVFRTRNLSVTRDLLLPKLASGEVDVEQLDVVAEREGT
jgi:type I restriction enzyme, S subunit